VLRPLARPLDDQFRRARGELGLPLRAAFEIASTPEEVLAALRRLARTQPAGILDLGGGVQGARVLLESLAGRSALPVASAPLRNPDVLRGKSDAAPKTTS
jgi:hypothetical protein